LSGLAGDEDNILVALNAKKSKIVGAGKDIID
jgi:hypothetical protein